jgi:exo-rhamnogalacturonan lyase-like protein
MKLCVSLAMVLLLSACAVADNKIVTLSIEEEAGVDRVNEPITMGVPLPEGKVEHAERLYLVDAAGKRVACQITEVGKWLDRKHIKWVHLTWNQSVKAKQTAKVSLMFRTGGVPRIRRVPVFRTQVKNGVATVGNRYVKLVIRGAKFDGFHKAWFDATGKWDFNDGNLVVDGRPSTGSGRGPAALGGSNLLNAPADSVKVEEGKDPKVTGATTRHSSANDPKGRVEIEERGYGRLVVKASGRHLGPTGHVLDYIVRIHLYANSPVVRVSHTFISQQGTKTADFHWMAGLNFDVPTKLAGGNVTVGTGKEPLRTGSTGSILQDTSDSFTITHELRMAAVKGKGKSTKPLTTGWIDVTRGKLGLAAGVKWFWQMNPKGLSVEKNGLLNVGLYPAGSRPLEVYMGQSRTHYMTFLFHDDKATAKQLNDLFAGTQRPLRAWAPGKYYTRDTHCFGYAVENDPELFGENWPKVQAWNRIQLKSVKMLLGKLDGNSYNGVSRDSYGVYGWGDRFHWGWPKWGTSPVKTFQWKQSWAGNYYDYPNAMIMSFLRTGDKTFLKRFFPNVIQMGDVHFANWHPSKARIGACRYCPPRNFVAGDGGNPYVSPEFNHWKSQSVYAHWYLSGDRRSLDHCKILANAAVMNRAASSGWAARGIGAQLIGLWNAYEMTLEQKYFNRMKAMAYRAMAQFKRGKYSKGGKFMWGIANEGLCHYYWVSGDPKVIEALKAGLAKYSGRSNYPNGALACAMMYRVTGEQKYADWAWKALTRMKVSSRVHNAGCQFRGTHFALYFLSDASKGWKPVKK